MTTPTAVPGNWRTRRRWAAASRRSRRANRVNPPDRADTQENDNIGAAASIPVVERDVNGETRVGSGHDDHAGPDTMEDVLDMPSEPKNRPG